MKFTWITNVRLVYLYLYLFINTAHWGILVTYVNLSSLWFQFLFLFLAYVWCLICIYQRTCHLWTWFHSCPVCFLSREHAIIHMIEHMSPFHLCIKGDKMLKALCKREQILTLLPGYRDCRPSKMNDDFGVSLLCGLFRHLFDSFKGAILSSECPVPYCHILQNWVLFNCLE